MSIKMQYCPKCGTKLDESITYKFCPRCGANLIETTTDSSEITVVNTIYEPPQFDNFELVEDSNSSRSKKIAFIIAAIILLLVISVLSINAINKKQEPKYDVITLTKDNYKQFLQVYTEDVTLVPKSSTSQKSEYRLSLVINSLDDNFIFEDVTAKIVTSSYGMSDYYKLTTSGFLKVSCSVMDNIVAKTQYLDNASNFIININGTVLIPRQ